MAQLFINGEDESINEKIIKEGFANYYFPSGYDSYSYKLIKAFDICVNDNINFCKKSNDVCANCVELKEFNVKKQEVVLYNICNKECDITSWSIKDEGRKSEKIFLPKIKIERCRQCDDDGWGICRSKGRCTIDDDFASVVDKVRKTDAVVFATPVYFSDLSESLRAFLDRLRRITRHKDGQRGISAKPAIGICVAGGGGGGAPACPLRP